MTEVRSGCIVRAVIQDEKAAIAEATSAAAKNALLAAYPEHLHKRPAIEAQLAMDATLYRKTIKHLLTYYGIDWTDVLPPEDVAVCLEGIAREISLDAEHAS